MTKISAARIDLEGGRVDNARLKDYGETCVGGAAGTNTGSAYTVDLSAGNVFNLILTANCTFTFSNAKAAGTASSFTLILKQDGTGGRTATWPLIIWAGGGAPPLTPTADRFDVFGFQTLDGGVTWFGFIAGLGYS